MGRGAAVTIARVQGVAIRLHATLLLGLFALAAVDRLSVGALLGALLVLGSQALGALYVARATRLDLDAVTLHGLGADVSAALPFSPVHRSALATGALGAQALLAGLAEISIALGPSLSPLGSSIAEVLVWPNLALLLLQLLPLPLLKGRDVWSLGRRLRAPRAIAVVLPEELPRTQAVVQARRVVVQAPRARSSALELLEERRPPMPPPIPSPTVVYESDIQLSRATEEYLRSVLDRARQKSQPKN
jgi:hypothetical protein